VLALPVPVARLASSAKQREEQGNARSGLIGDVDHPDRRAAGFGFLCCCSWADCRLSWAWLGPRNRVTHAHDDVAPPMLSMYAVRCAGCRHQCAGRRPWSRGNGARCARLMAARICCELSSRRCGDRSRCKRCVLPTTRPAIDRSESSSSGRGVAVLGGVGELDPVGGPLRTLHGDTWNRTIWGNGR